MRLALLALAALVWIAVPVSARAEGETVDTWDGKTIAGGFAAGEGTQDNPFQIETAAQLAIVPVLKLLETPADIFAGSESYLRIMLGGVAVSLVYNF